MHSWFFSLQFRLIAGFALVLALAIGSISLYIGIAAQRETDRFEEEMEAARAARVKHLVVAYSSVRPEWPGLQPALEQAGSLYDWRIVVTDRQGQVVGDSHKRLAAKLKDYKRGRRRFPVLRDGQEIGSVDMGPSNVPQIVAEPPLSRLVASLNRSLLWTGLAAGIGGILLLSLISRRVLAPVALLGSVARRLGQGDLTQRVPVTGKDEIGDLGLTFNTMADGLEKAEPQRRSLMADVAHELRTPLSNIQGYLEAVRDGVLEPDSPTIDTIYQQAAHLSDLVEDLRVLALAEAGVLRLNSEPDSLEDVLRRSVEAVKPRAEQRSVAVSLDISGDLPLVDMDRTRIAQVVGNLLENAIAHTPEGGQVQIIAEPAEPSRVRVTVADTGEGIAVDDLSQVFDRFYRVDLSRSRATGGAGLGLTIARQLVEAHGGGIRAESTSRQGSRFIFELPLAGPGSHHGGAGRGAEG